MRLSLPIFVTVLVTASPSFGADFAEFHTSPWFGERVRELWTVDGVRVVVNVPENFDAAKPTQLVVYATPNGNTVEQTLGSITEQGTDWHFDIQHVAAQVRRLREINPKQNVVLACIEAEGLSWPAWKKARTDGPRIIRSLVETLRGWLPTKDVSVALTGHSGGGSFLFGFLDGSDDIPSHIDSFVFLDANYSFADQHGDKLLSWLKQDRARRLVVVAYDDREVKLDGKLVVGPEGGTYRATERMANRFKKDAELGESISGDFRIRESLNGQIALLVHANPKNRILHTELVGEMNGLLRGLSPGGGWGTFGGPRAYAEWVQPAPAIPKRPVDAVGGKEFFRSLDKLSREEREEAVAREILRGNFPDFLRSFHKLTLTAKGPSGNEHTATLEVTPDYLAIGSDDDFVRVPMSPRTAARIVDAFGCSLPTRKLVDAIHQEASVRLDPKPLTEDRESAATFARHHALIEEQRKDKKLGELVSGIKKDVVISNRLEEKPNRVAIYGWHRLDGTPIQPLNVSHVSWYVDYSHGIRLVKRSILIDGKPRDLRGVLNAADLSALVSDEGPLRRVE